MRSRLRMTAEEVIGLLGLVPLHTEGGYFRETYRSADSLPAGLLPVRYSGGRSAGSAIYYVLTPESCSMLHRLRTDEIYHFYLGDPVEMLLLHPDGNAEMKPLGPGLEAGMRPQVVVPSGVWQGSRVMDGGRFALLGTTMAPGFDPLDFEAGDRESLIKTYPAFRKPIEALSPARGPS